MIGDLLTRLRVPCATEDSKKAADEIERLREALEKIAAYEIRDDLNYYNARAMIEMARAALNKSE